MGAPPREQDLPKDRAETAHPATWSNYPKKRLGEIDIFNPALKTPVCYGCGAAHHCFAFYGVDVRTYCYLSAIQVSVPVGNRKPRSKDPTPKYVLQLCTTLAMYACAFCRWRHQSYVQIANRGNPGTLFSFAICESSVTDCYPPQRSFETLACWKSVVACARGVWMAAPAAGGLPSARSHTKRWAT